MSGILFVVSAPSGAGKSSLVNSVLADDANLALSVSHTTRAPRPGEQNGREYHFVDRATFQAMTGRGEFLESAEVHGNYYGTSQQWIERTLGLGRDVMLEIDWQGAQQVRRLYRDPVTIFILPPSLEDLAHRLRSRGQDSEEVIRRRLANAAGEIGHAGEFDYVIINRDFDEARRDLAALVRAARLTFARQSARNPQMLNLSRKA